MLVEATLDFPKEEIDFLQKADAFGQLERLRPRSLPCWHAPTRRAAARRHQGGDCRPAQCGQKLAAQRAGGRAAIVTPIAGTTRDKVRRRFRSRASPDVIDTATCVQR
jgi:tRNA modification GTPase